MLCVDHEGVRPDIVAMGKAVAGGVLPASLTLADESVMKVLVHGSHGSTFGGNALAAKVMQAALGVVSDEKLP